MVKKKIKHLKLSTEKKKANAIFSKYIRIKALPKNYDLIECYTCGAWKPLKEMQCGHGIIGRNNAVLFMEEVCRPQDVQCNIFKSGNLAIFTRKLIAELGVEEYDRLAAEASKTVIYKAIDYVDIQNKYKKKLEELHG